MSPGYIDRWAEPFVRLSLHRRLGITFEQFLRCPDRYLRLVPHHPLTFKGGSDNGHTGRD